MTKKCINCDNVEIYKDNIAKCPKCGNYLKTTSIKTSDNSKNNNCAVSKHQDPYSNYFESQQNHDNHREEKDDLKDNSFFDFGNLNNDINEINNNKDKSEKLIRDKKLNNNLKQNKNEPEIEGIVKNFFEQEIPTFFITKVFRSLFLGLPLVVDNTVSTFQVYQGWGVNSGDNQTGTEVIIYGKIAKGKLPENNVVKIWGKKDKSGSVIAWKIYNNTSNTYVKINHTVNPIIIWTFFIMLIYIVYKLTQVNWGQVFASILSFIIMIIIILVGLYLIIISPIKSLFGKNNK